MIKVLNLPALNLIEPSVSAWTIWNVVEHPQSLYYIDLTYLDHFDWRKLVCGLPQFEQLCTEHNGWQLLSMWDWAWLLERQPLFEKYKPKSFVMPF